MIIITCIIMTEAFLKEANEFSDEEELEGPARDEAVGTTAAFDQAAC